MAIRRSGSSVIPAGSKRVLVNARHERAQRNPVLQAVTDRHRERVHDSGEGGALLRHPQEHLAGSAVAVLTHGDEPLAIGHAEFERARTPGARHPFPARRRERRGGPVTAPRPGGRRQRLTEFAVVAVHRERLESEPPRIDVQVGDVLHRRGFRKIDRLRNRPRQERLHRRHHPDMAARRDHVVAHGRREHRPVFVTHVRRALQGVLEIEIGHDVRDPRRIVSEA